MNWTRFAVGLVLALTLAAGCTKPADPPSAPDPPSNPPRPDAEPERTVGASEMSEGKKPDVPRTAPGFAEVMATLDDAKRTRAQLQCITLRRAAESYQLNPANPDANPPTKLMDLLAPPFGGPPFLDSADDLKDPWGREFKMELRTRPDGSEYLLFSTTARDGTPISQFGIGMKAKPEDQQLTK